MSDAHDRTILHQAAVEAVIDDQLDGDGPANVAIPDVGAFSVTYIQAEATELRTTTNAILAALRNSGIIPPA